MSSFRDRIVAELSRSVFAAGYHTPEEIIAKSKKLGVLPETLAEACLLRKERSTTTGAHTLTPLEQYANRRKSILVDAKGTRLLTMCCNAPVLALIDAEVARRQLDRTRFIRGIVLHYLLNTVEPPVLYPTWAEINPSDVKNGKTTKMSAISFAAGWVFTYRAERLRCTFNTLLRTLIINTLRGNYARHGEIEYPISPRHMPQNIHEYPGFSEEELNFIADNMQENVLETVGARKGLTGERRVYRGVQLPDGVQLKKYPKGPYYNRKKKQGAAGEER